jgi:hypothetical protein
MASAFDQPKRPIQGQLLRLSRRRQAAIYLRDGALWVADFVDGHGEITDARIWFRFNCASGSPSHMRRRMVLESAIPLSRDLVDQVERLHRLQHSAASQLASGSSGKT